MNIIITDSLYYECPRCGNDEIELGQNFCDNCGEPIEWKEAYECEGQKTKSRNVQNFSFC